MRKVRSPHLFLQRFCSCKRSGSCPLGMNRAQTWFWGARVVRDVSEPAKHVRFGLGRCHSACILLDCADWLVCASFSTRTHLCDRHLQGPRAPDIRLRHFDEAPICLLCKCSGVMKTLARIAPTISVQNERVRTHMDCEIVSLTRGQERHLRT